MNKHERYRARVSLDIYVEVSAPDDDEAVQRVGDVMTVLSDRIANGPIYRPRPPRRIAGAPIVHCIGAAATAPEPTPEPTGAFI